VWSHLGERRSNKDSAAPVAPLLWNENLLAVGSDGALAAWDAATGELRWRTPARGILGMTAAADRLYLAWPSGRLSALGLDGHPVWSRELGAHVVGGPSFALGTLWLGLEHDSLLAVSPEDGQEKLRYPLPAQALGRVAPVEPYVVVPTAGSQGWLLWFRPGDPHPVFKAEVDSPLRTDVRRLGDAAAVGALDGRVLAFRPRPAHK